ncbi:uncharacterized protein LOC141588444 [Silene latifolia]|uniref:uncharacterized protein LOC141588444 n=1 Tax=Silene latifolia TaxID=37657 RepID=UPI003D77983B
MYAHFLPEGAFDHTPCVIKSRRQLATHNKPFKYYNMWGKAANYINALINWWDVQQQEFFCDIENTSAMALKNLEYIQAQIVRNPGNADWISKEIAAQQEYKELQAACTQFLSQKAKAAWIKDGDNNSKYFHGVIKITLIPKMPTSVTQYRPIACCNVIYKCVSKLICNRLARVLPDLISLNQGGFIHGRSISENIMVCQDLVRLYNRKSCSPRCMFKMDLMKAYDSVSWRFVQELLDVYKFPPPFSKLLMECITSASFSLSLNGETFGFFPGKRGLRQGEPVSPLVFTLGDAQSIMILLRAYFAFLAASGLQMNAQKYWRLNKKDCSKLVDKIVERIRSLGAQRLSYAGGLILVNAVLTSMYTYWASMFVLPKGVLTKVDAICRSFLWEGKLEYTRVPQLSWVKICVPMTESGLGIKQSHLWNKASIGKLVWWIAAHPDKLWVQWVHHVYLKGVSWFDYNPPTDYSWHWRKVCHVKDLIKEGFVYGHWIIGSRGYTVKSCYNWLRDKRLQVDWHKAVWALQLKDKLARLQISQDDLCCLCQSASETHQHLFEDCHFSKSLLRGTSTWLSSDIAHRNVLHVINRKRWSSIRKKLCTAAVLTCWYTVWMQRNSARLEGSVTRPELVIQQIRRMIVCRFNECKPRVVSTKDRNWLCKVHLI